MPLIVHSFVSSIGTWYISASVLKAGQKNERIDSNVCKNGMCSSKTEISKTFVECLPLCGSLWSFVYPQTLLFFTLYLTILKPQSDIFRQDVKERFNSPDTNTPRWKIEPPQTSLFFFDNCQLLTPNFKSQKLHKYIFYDRQVLTQKCNLPPPCTPPPPWCLLIH